MRIRWKRIVLLTGIAAALCALFIATLLHNQSQYDDDRVAVYFFNEMNHRLQGEFIARPQGAYVQQLHALITQMQEAPQHMMLRSLWPNVPLYSVDLDDGIAILLFANSYVNLPPLEEALFRSALVLTLTSLPFVQAVEMRAADTDWYIREVRDNIANNPGISPARMATSMFTLFYVSACGTGLVAVPYRGEFDTQHRERFIVQRLIDGPPADMEGMVGTIPADTNIIRVNVEHGNAYVNLSGEFHSRFLGDADASRLMIYSIVNSLTYNVGHVRSVTFLIDSRRMERFHGVGNFHSSFEWDGVFLLNDQEDEQ